MSRSGKDADRRVKTGRGRTASSVFDLLRRTHESGRRELQLVQSQDEIAHPRMQFEVKQVR